jgi:hypothetical protein
MAQDGEQNKADQQTQDHDQRFKVLLKEFFPEFMQLFLPEKAEMFDFSKMNWLDKEVFVDPPAGSRRFLDLVAQLSTKHEIQGPREKDSDRMLALVHIEIESAESVEPLRRRMFRYYEQLRREHGLPVLAVALYLRVGLEGFGIDRYEEHFGDHLVLRFEYLYIGLPSLNAEEYLHGESALGIALSSLMKAAPGRRVALAAIALKRLLEYELTDWQRRLLCECLVAYSGMDEQQFQELEQIMASEPNGTEFPLTKTWFDRGLEQGMGKAREEERQRVASMIVRLIQRRLGTIAEGIIDEVRKLNIGQIEELSEVLLELSSVDELVNWLQKQQA